MPFSTTNHFHQHAIYSPKIFTEVEIIGKCHFPTVSIQKELVTM
jgi:hypothetical protein